MDAIGAGSHCGRDLTASISAAMKPYLGFVRWIVMVLPLHSRTKTRIVKRGNTETHRTKPRYPFRTTPLQSIPPQKSQLRVSDQLLTFDAPLTAIPGNTPCVFHAEKSPRDFPTNTCVSPPLTIANNNMATINNYMIEAIRGNNDRYCPKKAARPHPPDRSTTDQPIAAVRNARPPPLGWEP